MCVVGNSCISCIMRLIVCILLIRYVNRAFINIVSIMTSQLGLDIIHVIKHISNLTTIVNMMLVRLLLQCSILLSNALMDVMTVLATTTTMLSTIMV